MKRNIYRLLLFVLFLNSLFLALPQPAYACSCVGPTPPADAFRDSGAVFTGRVTNLATAIQIPFITPALARLGIFTSDPWNTRQAALTVTRSWKGVATTQITVRTGQGGGDCGYGFQEGHEYLIYAYQSNNNWITNICTRTAPTAFAGAADDFTYLTTQPTLTLTPTAPSRSLAPYLAIPLLLLPLALAAIWYIRRKRKAATST